MHTDTKTGLALGILAAGIVSALFFPNDADRLDNAPRMRDPDAVDARIAERAVAPYLTRRKQEHVPATPQSQVPYSQPSKLPEFLKGDRHAIVGVSAGLPDPIPVPATESTAPREAVVADRTKPPAKSEDDPAAQRRKYHNYRIQPGDTLTGIAHRFLGAGSRFTEIYEANCDLIPDPNRLLPDRVIRIPAAGAVPSELQTSRTHVAKQAEPQTSQQRLTRKLVLQSIE